MIPKRNDFNSDDEYYLALGKFLHNAFIIQGLYNKKNIKVKDVDSEELKMGISVEFEHTSDPEVSMRIALDHLAKIPDYYTRLKKMEDNAFKETKKQESMSFGYGRGQGMGMNRRTPNAPTMAFYTVYKRWPSPPLFGREISHPTKNINGIQIDRYIPTSAIKALFNIECIQPTSSCQGEDTRHVTFFIFRPKNQDENYVKNICIKLKQFGYKCYYDKGMQGYYRICVAEKIWYDENNKYRLNNYMKWWFRLPKILQRIC